MSQKIFTNQTTNRDTGAIYPVNGNLQVDISGVLGGADVITYYNEIGVAPIVSCSWRTSAGDTLNTADGGVEWIGQRMVGFKIINAGVSTNITLSFTVQ